MPHARVAQELDSPERIFDLRTILKKKGFLRRFYLEVYRKYLDTLSRIHVTGKVVELGSGASFLKEVLPEAVTSDLIGYSGVDLIVDATRMPFADGSVRAFFMMNVFHHIPDVEAFLREADRCLAPGGRIFILDQHVGWLSRILLGRLHHEPFRPEATKWQFDSSGPLSGANGALAWIVFQRDLAAFKGRFPKLSLVQYRPHSPFRYWLAGGLKGWSLLPGWTFWPVSALERGLSSLHSGWCCFADIEIEKMP